MTNQEFFDKAAVGMLRQMEQSMAVVDGSYTCAYRGSNGRKCGVGHAIPDVEYSGKLEGLSGATLIHTNMVPSLCGVDGLLADLIQEIHDNCCPGSWREALRDVAQHNGFSTAAMDAVPEAP